MVTRSLEIAMLLAEDNRFYSYYELSTHFGISERAIRYEINYLKEWIEKLSLKSIEFNRNNGVRLVLTKEEIQYLNQNVSKNQECNLLKFEERVLKIILLVIQKNESLYVKDIQEILGISKSTLDNDLKKLRVFLDEYHVTLVSTPKVGLEILGSEISIRIVLNALIQQSCNVDTYMKRYNENGIFSQIEQEVLQYIDGHVIQSVYNEFLSKREKNVLVNENYYIHLALNFAISFKRIREGNLIDKFDETYTHYVKAHVYDVISVHSPMIENLPMSEKCFLCFIIDSYNIHQSPIVKEDWIQIQLITLQLIKNMQTIMDIAYEKDQQLFERLFYHIEALIKRTKQGLSLFNPMTTLIKEQYAYTFYAVKQAIKEIEMHSQTKLDDAEVAYITVHFCASGEKIEKERFEPYRVVVMCGHGVATGELLAQKLNKIEYLDVIGVINSKDLDILKRLDAHLVIKTTDIDIPYLPSIKVNPLFNEVDLELLKKELAHCEPLKKTKYRVDFKELYMDIIHLIQSESEALFSRLQPQIEEVFLQKNLITKEGVQPMLEEVLELNHILPQQNAENWQDAIRLAATPLIEDEYINPSYVDAMIENVNKFGPYIVIAKGFALAHARPEDGVNKLGVSILTLSEPIPFHSAQNDPVKIVLCLAAIDNSSHLKIMSTIATLLNNEQKLEQLLTLDNASDLKKLLCQSN